MCYLADLAITRNIHIHMIINAVTYLFNISTFIFNSLAAVTTNKSDSFSLRHIIDFDSLSQTDPRDTVTVDTSLEML